MVYVLLRQMKLKKGEGRTSVLLLHNLSNNQLIESRKTMKNTGKVLFAMLIVTMMFTAVAFAAMPDEATPLSICAHGPDYEEPYSEGDMVDLGSNHAYITTYYTRCTICGKKVETGSVSNESAHVYGEWSTYTTEDYYNSTHHYLRRNRVRTCTVCGHNDHELLSSTLYNHYSSGWPVDEECSNGYHRFYRNCTGCGVKYMYKSEEYDGEHHPSFNRYLPIEETE